MESPLRQSIIERESGGRDVALLGKLRVTVIEWRGSMAYPIQVLDLEIQGFDSQDECVLRKVVVPCHRLF